MASSPDVDEYIRRAEMWPDEMAAVRPILLDGGLSEAIKWNKPCYSFEDDNILVLQEMKKFLAILFFKGVLIDDTEQVLEAQGPNTRSAKRICITSVQDVAAMADTITNYVEQAIGIEEAGLEVGPAPEPTCADALQARLDEDPSFRSAFESLTPGRRREYNLHFSDAKKAETRASRVEKYAPKILAGKGFRDR